MSGEGRPWCREGWAEDGERDVEEGNRGVSRQPPKALLLGFSCQAAGSDHNSLEHCHFNLVLVY
jgi:hypothetical protein